MEFLAPDFSRTLRRFPIVVVLLTLATLVAIAMVGVEVDADEETIARLFIGLGAGAVFALAGRLFAESGSGNRISFILLEIAVPLLVIAAMQVQSSQWVSPAPLTVAAFLWLSVAGFVRGRGSEAEEDRFWWVNHRAVTTGIIAAAGFLIIAIGILAIERSLALLFGIEGERIFYGYLLPFTGAFLAPVYWLSTIPHREDFRAEEMTSPDFLSRAIGFLGHFVLMPLLLAYSAILLVYAVQIAVALSLPEGTLGWMVLGYLVVGAATWLILHPPFMRERQSVRLFRRFWFWLTIVPVLLFGAAVWVRVDAYGLTSERVFLIAGGLWAVFLTIAFLSRRFADIRMIPGLAAVILTLLAIGPWNFENLAAINQASRFSAALASSGWTAENDTPGWSAKDAEIARSSYAYLQGNDRLDTITPILAERGLAIAGRAEHELYVPGFLNLPPITTEFESDTLVLTRDPAARPVDLGDNRFYFGEVSAAAGTVTTAGQFTLAIEGNLLILNHEGEELARGDLSEWVALQTASNSYLTEVLFTLSGSDGRFALIANYLMFDNAGTVESIYGTLFAERLPIPSPEGPSAPGS